MRPNLLRFSLFLALTALSFVSKATGLLSDADRVAELQRVSTEMSQLSAELALWSHEIAKAKNDKSEHRGYYDPAYPHEGTVFKLDVVAILSGLKKYYPKSVLDDYEYSGLEFYSYASRSGAMKHFLVTHFSHPKTKASCKVAIQLDGGEGLPSNMDDYESGKFSNDRFIPEPTTFKSVEAGDAELIQTLFPDMAFLPEMIFKEGPNDWSQVYVFMPPEKNLGLLDFTGDEWMHRTLSLAMLSNPKSCLRLVRSEQGYEMHYDVGSGSGVLQNEAGQYISENLSFRTIDLEPRLPIAKYLPSKSFMVLPRESALGPGKRLAVKMAKLKELTAKIAELSQTPEQHAAQEKMIGDAKKNAGLVITLQSLLERARRLGAQVCGLGLIP